MPRAAETAAETAGAWADETTRSPTPAAEFIALLPVLELSWNGGALAPGTSPTVTVPAARQIHRELIRSRRGRPDVSRRAGSKWQSRP